MPRRWIMNGLTAALAAGLLVAAPAAAGSRTADPQQQTLASLGARHHLAVGTALDTAVLADPAEDTYRQIAATQFSSVTAENAMKWETIEPTRGTYDWSQADAFMRFAEQNGQQVRGHVLIWHNQLPVWLTEGVAGGSISRAELRELFRRHITEVVSRYRGRIGQWDVVNEAVSDAFETDNVIKLRDDPVKGFWLNNYGPDYIADAFRIARAADRRALLFYNDYNIDAFGSGGADDKTQFVFDLVKDLRAQGVPIDGVGSQAHLSTRYGNYSAFQIAEMHNRFAALGVATAITEADVRSLITDDLRAGVSDAVNETYQAQAFNYAALMQGCLAARRCLSFTVWGFDDRHTWTASWDFGSGPGGEALAAIHDAEYRPKPAYDALRAAMAYAAPPLVHPRIPQRPSR